MYNGSKKNSLIFIVQAPQLMKQETASFHINESWIEWHICVCGFIY